MIVKKIAAFNSLHRGKVLVTLIPSTAPEYFAWVGVYPLDITRETTRELLRNYGVPIPLSKVQAYRIRKFEVNRALVEEDKSVAEPELEKKADYFVFGDEELIEKLEQLGVRIEQLEPPFKFNYPI